MYNATTYRNAQEEVQGVFTAARDITERNKAEEARKESEKKYRTLVEQSKQGLLLGQGGFLMWFSLIPLWKLFQVIVCKN